MLTECKALFALALSALGVLFVCESLPVLVNGVALFTQSCLAGSSLLGPDIALPRKPPPNRRNRAPERNERKSTKLVLLMGAAVSIVADRVDAVVALLEDGGIIARTCRARRSDPPGAGPVRNRWLYQSGMIACALVPLWALVFGHLRGIPGCGA